MNYYNEFDPQAAAWLGELIKRQLIPQGVVDTRSICDVQPEDLKDFTQVHLFAGIGGWSYALRLAGWPEDMPVWTGSCPCQPFSAAGKRKGTKDERHLWPEMLRLLRVRKPAKVFGEQVASKDGRLWFSGVRADLEELGYAVGAADLCAAGLGSPHIRQRLYWMADSQYQPEGAGVSTEQGPTRLGRDRPSVNGDARRLVDTLSERGCGGNRERQDAGHARKSGPWENYEVVGCRDGKLRRIESGSSPVAHGIPARVVRLRGYGNAIVPQLAAEFIEAST